MCIRDRIYSFAANEETEDGALSEEESSAEGLDAGSRDFLERVIKDYNQMFSTNFDTSADKFQNYYKDLSLRLKNRELDVVIVVNMFLTGCLLYTSFCVYGKTQFSNNEISSSVFAFVASMMHKI